MIRPATIAVADAAPSRGRLVLVGTPQMIDDFAIQHTAEGWQRWREQVAVLGAEKIAVGVETSHGMVVEQ